MDAQSYRMKHETSRTGDEGGRRRGAGDKVDVGCTSCGSQRSRNVDSSTYQPRSPVLLVVIKTKRLFALSPLFDRSEDQDHFEKIRRIGAVIYAHTQHSKRTTYHRLCLDFNLEQQINRSSIRLSISRNSTALQSILYHPQHRTPIRLDRQ